MEYVEINKQVFFYLFNFLFLALSGQSCANGETCMGGSNCQSNQCVCPKAMTAQNGICTLITGNLGPCTDNTQCTGGAFCDPIRQLCLCPGIFLC